MGDGKFAIWMNIERQVAISKPVLVERAGCIYIDDFVIATKKIIDSWSPGTYNISYNFTRNSDALKETYPHDFEVKEKLGPTGKPRGLLSSDKLLETFNIEFTHKNNESTVKEYYTEYENFRSQQ